ncbi:hypothetical protein BMIN_0770 [Bifidobacterium minimum]|uniref:Uncharacterized protein n=1 Tax=Bifidobacterium minimum TaxID=1693 RepID=A0A087BPV1_9BIFI|nr:hypothetical protein [Bifidobacterium minimum]KFI73051.1 hypothetical protein BMIN_0770 [Bifidobacterium minimum]
MRRHDTHTDKPKGPEGESRAPRDGGQATERRGMAHGGKKSRMSMSMGELLNTGGKGGKKSKAPRDTTADWRLRSNLLPKSIAVINRDRMVQRIMTLAVVVVLIFSVLVTIFMKIVVVATQSQTENQRQLAMSLQQTKAKYADVEKIVTASDDTQKVLVSTLYDEIDWQTVATNLDSALPANTSYTSLQLTEFQPETTGSSSSSSSSSTAGDVWGSGGVIDVAFTVKSTDFVTAKTFITNFSKITGYIVGDISSISGSPGEGYTYTGTVSLDLTGNTTSRGDSAGGAETVNRELLDTLRKDLRSQAGVTTSSEKE